MIHPNKPGLVLVAHGSRSADWNTRVLELAALVGQRPEVANVFSGGVAAAFLEGFQFPIAPTILNQLNQGATAVVVVPVFLTASGHLEEEIPVILGLRTDSDVLAMLIADNIPVLPAGLPVILAPPLAPSVVLPRNVAKRAAALAPPATDSGVVLVYYGSSSYQDRWTALLDSIGAHLVSMGYGAWDHGAVGHVVQMSPVPVFLAIRRLLTRCQKVAVVPLLVSRSGFQDLIIPDALQRLDVSCLDRVRYVADAILPDPEIVDWVVDTALKALSDPKSPMDRPSALK